MTDLEQLAQEFKKFRDEQRENFLKYKKTQSDIVDGLIQSHKEMAQDLETRGTQIDQIQGQLTVLLEKYRNEVIN